MNCANEPTECRDIKLYTTQDCYYGSIPFYCPVLCGICPTISVVNTTITTTQNNVKKCNLQLPCLNGVKQDLTSCSCECYPAYSGVICENLNCSNEPKDCQNPQIYIKDDCQYGTIQFYCPVLCGKCVQVPKQTTTTTPLNSCLIKSCNNGGKLNTTTCQCQCKHKSLTFYKTV